MKTPEEQILEFLDKIKDKLKKVLSVEDFINGF